MTCFEQLSVLSTKESNVGVEINYLLVEKVTLMLTLDFLAQIKTPSVFLIMCLH